MPHYTKVDRLRAAVMDRITSGEFPPGSKLPSQSALCKEYDVSMQTVRTVMGELKARGIVDGVPGSGYYVRHIPGPAE